MERRLAAILAADVAGYTRLMANDEAGTLRRLKAHRQELLEPLVAAHRGRIVKLMGDGLLIEFVSIVDAVACAAAWQEKVAEKEAEQAEDARLQYRIGINVGDVIIDDDDIYGDGVNIAARLEGLAEPGCVCLSSDAYRQVRGKVDLNFEDLGELDIKNVAEPMTVYRVVSNNYSAAGNTALLPIINDTQPFSAEHPNLAGASGPSIAVLPFENLSGDDDQDFFADGMTEDIITELSRFRSLSIIDRRSSFVYKGQAVSMQDVAKDLGISYALVGSVRMAGKRARIAAQLVDAATGRQIWAERYDREIEDIFMIQDEIAATIVAALEPQIGVVERQSAQRKPPGNLDAWECYQRGLWHLQRTTRADNAEAQLLMERSIDLDAEFSLAYSGLSQAYHQQIIMGWTEDAAEAHRQANAAALQAIAIDAYDPQAHVALGREYVMRGDNDAALAELREAIDLNPNLALAHYRLGVALIFAGRAREALSPLKTAIRQSPRDPQRAGFDRMMGIAHFMLAEHEDALPWLQTASRHSGNNYWSCLGLAANYAAMGNLEMSRAALKDVQQIKPDLTITFVADFLRGQDPEYNDYYLSQLRRAGLQA